MRRPKPPKFVTLAILTTITIIFWVFFSVYRILTTEVSSSVTLEILAPITPELDTEALKSLEKRIYFDNTNFEFTTHPPTENVPIEETNNIEIEENESIEGESETDTANDSNVSESDSTNIVQ